jgi:predicted transcriptional regulator
MIQRTITEEQRQAFQRFMKAKGLNPFQWAKKAGVAQSVIPNFLKARSNSITTTTLIKLAKVPGAEKVLDIFGIASPSAIDPDKLRMASEAVEKVLIEKNIKLSQKDTYILLVEVYNQGIKYEMQGESTSPKVIAELLIARGAG